MSENNEMWILKKPRSITWKPKDDITTKELADLLPFFSFAGAGDHSGGFSFFDSLNESAKRHFVDSDATSPPQACT